MTALFPDLVDLGLGLINILGCVPPNDQLDNSERKLQPSSQLDVWLSLKLCEVQNSFEWFLC